MWKCTLPVLLAVSALTYQFRNGADNTSRNIYKQRAMAALVQTNNELACHVYKELDDGNVIFSPLSLTTMMGLAYVGANGSSALQIKQALNIELDVLKAGVRRLMSRMKIKNSITSTTIQIANAAFVQSSFPIKDEFSATAKQIFKTKVENLDFANNTQMARKKINGWVKKKTRKKIINIIPQDGLDPLTKLVLINILYLNAAWFKVFPPGKTDFGIFHVSPKKQIRIPMMHSRYYYRYGHLDDLNAAILELSFKEGTVCAFIILPDSTDGLKDVERKVLSTNLQSIFKEYDFFKVDVTIPKFRLKKSFNMNKILQKLGVTDIFENGLADFSGISDHKDRLSVSQVLHKGFIEIDEFGVEAAATSVLTINTMTGHPPKKFVADRPFLFIIWEKTIKTVLFMGRCVQP